MRTLLGVCCALWERPGVSARRGQRSSWHGARQILEGAGVVAGCLAFAACQSLAPMRPESAARELEASLAVIGAPEASPRQRAQAEAAYRLALSRVLPQVTDGQATPTFQLGEGDPPAWPAPEIFSQVTPVPRPHLRTPELHRDGLGVPAVGRIFPVGANAPRRGFHTPLTAVALPVGTEGDFEVRLADPLRVDAVPVGRRLVPLAVDLEAPLDATRAMGPGVFDGLRYLLRADRFGGQSRVTFLQPFDPAKQPLVLIHGLMTTPRMWDGLVRDLLADPVVRDGYQIWLFFYPTAQPVALSALQLRDALDEARRRHGLAKPLVLVGFSMGGILARAQISGLTLADAERIAPGVSDLPELSPVRRALVFEPRADVGRVIFIFTPHRGSQLATWSLAVWASRLIRLPEWLRSELTEIVDEATGLPYGALPTSIQGLSPRSRFLRSLDQVPPRVPAHSIIGDRGRGGDPREGSDGVVPFMSAHLPGAVSERIVPTGHGGFGHPAVAQELKRILREELASRQARADNDSPSTRRVQAGAAP